MDVSFVLVTPDLAQRVIPLGRPRTVMGRQTDCNIRIPSGSVSRQHCEVLIDGGTVTIKDLGSSNGTYINLKKVAQAQLKPGDMIGIGGCVFVVRIDGQPSIVDSEDALEDGLVKIPDAPVSATGESATVISPRPAVPGKGRLAEADPNDDSDSFDFDFTDDEDEKKSKKPPKR